MANHTFSTVTSFLAAKSTLVGDSGSDTLSFAGSSTAITLIDDDFLGMDAVTDSNTKIENLVGSSSAANSMTLGLQAENKGISNITGGAAADAIDASNYSAATTINGGTGNDIILAGAAEDSLLGGAGADSILGGSGNDTILGEADADTISGDAGNDSILGGDGADSLVGGDGNNTLSGGGGNDTLSSSSSSDSLIGGDGNDYYFVSSTSGANIYEVASGGTDSVSTVVEDYTLGSELEVLILAGTVVEGTGNGLANTLLGNATANSLDGGAGNDYMAGGAGDDYYIVDSTLDAAVEAASGGADSVFANVSGFTLGSEVELLVLNGTVAVGTGGATAKKHGGNTTLSKNTR